MLLLFGTLPKTVKGSVQRNAADSEFRTSLDALADGRYTGATLAEASAAGSSLVYDSLATASSGGSGGEGGGGGYSWISGLRFFCILLVGTADAFLTTS